MYYRVNGRKNIISTTFLIKSLELYKKMLELLNVEINSSPRQKRIPNYNICMLIGLLLYYLAFSTIGV